MVEELLIRLYNILNVSELSITFTYDFKVLIIKECMFAKLPRETFSENGFDINIIGLKRIEQASYR